MAFEKEKKKSGGRTQSTLVGVGRDPMVIAVGVHCLVGASTQIYFQTSERNQTQIQLAGKAAYSIDDKYILTSPKVG
jgi:hypothetical protein